MTEFPGFGGLLARLSEYDGVGPAELAERAGATERELRAVLGGAAPDAPLLHRLAPALDLRVPDLFAVAAMDVPRDLAPIDEHAGVRVPWLAMKARDLPAERRTELLDFVRRLPQERRTGPVPPPRLHERYEPGFGALLVRMLATRNLSLVGVTQALWAVSGPCLAASTIGQVGRGRKELTPDLLVAFAHALGVAPGRLSALTGVGLDGPPPEHDPSLADAAALLWEARRLNSAQVKRIRARLTALAEA
jgi:hypothetical protein